MSLFLFAEKYGVSALCDVAKGVATSMIPLPFSSARCVSTAQTTSWSTHFVTLQTCAKVMQRISLSRELNFFFEEAVNGGLNMLFPRGQVSWKINHASLLRFTAWKKKI